VNEGIDGLLQAVTGGDRAAADRVFLEIEPYLRKVVRRQLPRLLQAKFDSVDILQSAWASALSDVQATGRQFSNVDQLRGFLYVITRNRLIDRIRRFSRMKDREEFAIQSEGALELSTRAPRPSEEAVAAELWEKMHACCPIEHRAILDLKRQGYCLSEIGERTGLHPDSVRRILRGIARQLACQADSPEG
jgi:RNA polymerase sigma factor (sigma-70 family)